MAREILLTQGYVTVVDDEDYEALSAFEWRAFINKDATTVYAKRSVKVAGVWRDLAMQNVILPPPPGFVNDHKDGDGLNNRRGNLRPATLQQNARNKGPARSNKAGFRGVAPCKDRWRAAFYLDGKPVHLGMFRAPEDAARAYDFAAALHYGEFARPNFPDMFGPPPMPIPRRQRGVNAPKVHNPRLSATGFKGVEFDAGRGRYRATIQANRTKYRLGRFLSAEEAALAYDAAARRLHGANAILNFAEAA
jgi:hypothetical protein